MVLCYLLLVSEQSFGDISSDVCSYDIYGLRNSRIARYNSGIGGQSRVPTLRRDNSGIVPILTLRRTYILCKINLAIILYGSVNSNRILHFIFL